MLNNKAYGFGTYLNNNGAKYKAFGALVKAVDSKYIGLIKNNNLYDNGLYIFIIWKEGKIKISFNKQ